MTTTPTNEKIREQIDRRAEKQGKTPRKNKPSEGEVLQEITSKLNLFTQDGKPYAEAQDSNIYSIDVRDEAWWLLLWREYDKATSRPLSDTAFKETTTRLQAYKDDYSKDQIWHRIGHKDGKTVIDLGVTDGGERRFVIIDSNGWHMSQSNEGVRLYRSNYQNQLPSPVAGDGTTFHKLKDILKLNQEQWILLLAYLLSVFFRGNKLHLFVAGGGGNGKTALVRTILQMIDPRSVGEERNTGAAPPRNEEDYIATMNKSFLPVIDNASALSSDLSDHLCRAATGGLIIRRTLYTNFEASMVAIRRSVIITSISDLVRQDDLRQRIIKITRSQTLGGVREEDDAVNAKVDELLPNLLSELYSAVSRAIKNRDTIRLSKDFRMMDVTRFIAAGIQEFGITQQEFEDAYHNNQTEMINTMAGSDVFVQAVERMLRKEGRVACTPAELVTRLKNSTPSEEMDEAWRKAMPTQQTMRNRLRKVSTILAPRGIKFEEPTRGTERILILTRVGGQQHVYNPDNNTVIDDEAVKMPSPTSLQRRSELEATFFEPIAG
jgi:hypothetical protein